MEQRGRHSPTRAARSAIAATAILLVGAILSVGAFLYGCGSGSAGDLEAPGTGSSGPTSTGTTGVTTAPLAPTEPLGRLRLGGSVLGLVFERPLPLEEALALVRGVGGDPIAVYRTDYACVRPITGGMPDWKPEPSRFAYVDAGDIRQRRIAAVDAGQSPPITGWAIAESYWLHWEDQWMRAREPGVLIEAVAAYAWPTVAQTLGGDPRIRALVTLPHRRTDSLDPGFPGELLLESEEFAPGMLSEPPRLDCGDAPTVP